MYTDGIVAGVYGRNSCLTAVGKLVKKKSGCT